MCGKPVLEVINGRGHETVIPWCPWTVLRLHQLAAFFQVTPTSLRKTIIPRQQQDGGASSDSILSSSSVQADSDNNNGHSVLTAICKSINCWFPEDALFQNNIPRKVEVRILSLLETLHRNRYIVIYKLPFGGRPQVYWPERTRSWYAQDSWNYDYGPEVSQEIRDALRQVASGREVPAVVRRAAENVQFLPFWSSSPVAGVADVGTSAGQWAEEEFLDDDDDDDDGDDGMDLDFDSNPQTMQPAGPPPFATTQNVIHNAPRRSSSYHVSSPAGILPGLSFAETRQQKRHVSDSLVDKLHAWNQTFNGSPQQRAMFEASIIQPMMDDGSPPSPSQPAQPFHDHHTRGHRDFGFASLEARTRSDWRLRPGAGREATSLSPRATGHRTQGPVSGVQKAWGEGNSKTAKRRRNKRFLGLEGALFQEALPQRPYQHQQQQQQQYQQQEHLPFPAPPSRSSLLESPLPRYRPPPPPRRSSSQNHNQFQPFLNSSPGRY